MEPGQAAGMIAAQSLGQPMTQVTLSSFHKTGTGQKEVLEGIPRMEEIINTTFRTENSTCTFLVNSYYEDSDIDKLTNYVCVQQSSKLIWIPATRLFVNLNVENLVKNYYFEDNFESWWYDIAEATGFYSKPLKDKNKCMLRLEFRKDLMFKHRVSLLKIIKSIRNNISSEEVKLLASPESEAIIDITVDYDYEEYCEIEKIKIKLMKLTKTFIFNSRVCGINGIIDAWYETYEPEICEYEISEPKISESETYETEPDAVTLRYAPKIRCYTLGTNIRRLLFLDEVDGESITSNSPKDIIDAFGIEAARKILVEEISKVIEGKIRYDNKHINLLADFMTSRGTIMSANRYSQSMKEKSALSRASYESTMRELIQACSKGDDCCIKEVSESIITGRRIRVGTGFSIYYKIE